MSKRQGLIVMIFVGVAVFFLFNFAMEENPKPPPAPTAKVIPTSTDAAHSAYLPVIADSKCSSYNSRLDIKVDQTVVKVNETLTVSLVLRNDGCSSLGLPAYQIQAPNLKSFIRLSPTLQPHNLSVLPNGKDSVDFVFKAGTPGRVEIHGRADFEVHLASGPALKGSAESTPITITILEP